MIEPELFTPEAGHYLGLLQRVRAARSRARPTTALREVVGNLWALAVTIEDGNISDVDKALRAAQEALKQALERGASDEEIKKLTENLRAALDNFMRQLAEQLKNNPQQLARPLDPNTTRAAAAGPQQHDRPHGAAVALRRQGRRQAVARTIAADAGKPADGAARPVRRRRHGAGAERTRRHDPQAAAAARQDLQAGPGFAPRSQARQAGRSEAWATCSRTSRRLRDRLQKLQQELAKRGMGGPARPEGRAGPARSAGQGQHGNRARATTASAMPTRAMGDAGGRLGDGNADGAVDSQGKALDALRKGAQNLAESMQPGDGDGQGDGPGQRAGRQQSGGRQTAIRSAGRCTVANSATTLTVKIPGEIDVQRVRRILEELAPPARRSAAPADRARLPRAAAEGLLRAPVRVYSSSGLTGRPSIQRPQR